MPLFSEAFRMIASTLHFKATEYFSPSVFALVLSSFKGFSVFYVMPYSCPKCFFSDILPASVLPKMFFFLNEEK
jgi:hypothetical protein